MDFILEKRNINRELKNMTNVTNRALKEHIKVQQSPKREKTYQLQQKQGKSDVAPLPQRESDKGEQ